MRPRNPLECPHCGAAVRRGALACPECGSDAATGWSDEAETGGLDLGLADDDFDYEAFVERELGGRPAPRRRAGRLVAAALLIVLVLALLL